MQNAKLLGRCRSDLNNAIEYNESDQTESCNGKTANYIIYNGNAIPLILHFAFSILHFL